MDDGWREDGWMEPTQIQDLPLALPCCWCPIVALIGFHCPDLRHRCDRDCIEATSHRKHVDGCSVASRPSAKATLLRIILIISY